MSPNVYILKEGCASGLYIMYTMTADLMSVLLQTSHTPECCWQSAAWRCCCCRAQHSCLLSPRLSQLCADSARWWSTSGRSSVSNSVATQVLQQLRVRAHTQVSARFRHRWDKIQPEKKRKSVFNGVSQKWKQWERPLWGGALNTLAQITCVSFSAERCRRVDTQQMNIKPWETKMCLEQIPA